MLSLDFWSIYLFDLAQNYETLGIQMRTNCVPLVAVLLLFCYERDSMWSFYGNYHVDIIKAFSSTSRYLNGLITEY